MDVGAHLRLAENAGSGGGGGGDREVIFETDEVRVRVRVRVCIREVGERRRGVRLREKRWLLLVLVQVKAAFLREIGKMRMMMMVANGIWELH